MIQEFKVKDKDGKEELVRRFVPGEVLGLMNEIEAGTNPYQMDVLVLLDNWKRLKSVLLFFATASKDEIEERVNPKAKA